VSVTPAAGFLVDFDAQHFAPIVEETPQPVATVSPEIALAQRIEEAYARGLAEGRSAAEAEALARLEEQAAAMEQGLAAARAAWCAEEAPRLAEQIATAIRDMEERLAQATERVLRPFLAQAVRERAMGELKALIDELLQTSPGLTLEIAGPEDLLGDLRATLPAVAAVSFVAGAATDVQVKAGASIIETRIAAWLKDSVGQAA
jgi:hypothetical protein